jgi:hypothetical protein
MRKLCEAETWPNELAILGRVLNYEPRPDGPDQGEIAADLWKQRHHALTHCVGSDSSNICKCLCVHHSRDPMASQRKG